MTIHDLLIRARQIWGPVPASVRLEADIIVPMGVVYGDICRWARDAPLWGSADAEFKKELGNLIFSTIRWCDDLELDPEECVRLAIEAQERFVREPRK